MLSHKRILSRPRKTSSFETSNRSLSRPLSSMLISSALSLFLPLHSLPCFAVKHLLYYIETIKSVRYISYRSNQSSKPFLFLCFYGLREQCPYFMYIENEGGAVNKNTIPAYVCGCVVDGFGGSAIFIAILDANVSS